LFFQRLPDEATDIKFFKKEKPFLFGLFYLYCSSAFLLNWIFPNSLMGRNEDIINEK